MDGGRPEIKDRERLSTRMGSKSAGRKIRLGLREERQGEEEGD